jgi:hypothetical protein
MVRALGVVFARSIPCQQPPAGISEHLVVVRADVNERPIPTVLEEVADDPPHFMYRLVNVAIASTSRHRWPGPLIWPPDLAALSTRHCYSRVVAIEDSRTCVL